MKAYRLHAFGDPADFRLEDVPTPAPAAGELLIQQTAIGVNFADSMRLRDAYPGPPLPSGLGYEGAGVVEAVGTGVGGFVVGDRVAALGGGFSYADYRVAPANRCIKLPAGVSEVTAGAAFLKGLTAGALAQGAYAIQPGDVVLVHAAAGGVGQLLSQWAKTLGATVIGTVGSDAKRDFALAHGCDQVVNYQTEDFVARVHEITEGRGVAAVYDSVGLATAMGSLDCLREGGTLVRYGGASGPAPPMDEAMLAAKGSLKAVSASFFTYVAEDADLARLSQDLFDRLESGAVKVAIAKTYPLQDAAVALADIASRSTVGALVITP